MAHESNTDTVTPRFDTGQIGPHRALMAKLAEKRIVLGGIAQFEIVVDVNMVLPDLVYRARRPDSGPTRLEELIKSTVVVAHAPLWLKTEMASNIAVLANQYDIGEEKIWERWTAFQTLIVWHATPLPPSAPDSNCCDPKDIPYVWLEKKIAAAGTLTKDKHIAKLGGHPLSGKFVINMRDYARATVVSSSIRISGVSVSIASIAIVSQLFRGISNGITAMPPSVKALLVAGGIVAIAHPDSRRWLADRCVDIVARIYRAGAALTEIISFMAQQDAEAQAAAIVSLTIASAMVKPKRVQGRAYRRARRPNKTAALAPAISHLAS